MRDLASAGFYADADAAVVALEERRQFNVIHMESAWKVDLIIRKDRPFSAEEFGRRTTAALQLDVLWRLARDASGRQ